MVRANPRPEVQIQLEDGLGPKPELELDTELKPKLGTELKPYAGPENDIRIESEEVSADSPKMSSQNRMSRMKK